jgi:hypothetical protein
MDSIILKLSSREKYDLNRLIRNNRIHRTIESLTRGGSAMVNKLSRLREKEAELLKEHKKSELLWIKENSLRTTAAINKLERRLASLRAEIGTLLAPIEYEVHAGVPYLVLRRDCEDGATDQCPFCGRTHWHGSGDGGRVPHCATDASITVLAPDGTQIPSGRQYVVKTRHLSEV